MTDDIKAGSPLLSIRNLTIEGRSSEGWIKLVDGVDLDLARGEILGLIGESGAGKSTLGLAAMGFTRDGCRIAGGSIDFDGIDLVGSGETVRRDLRGKRIAYVAQSAAASFNPAHKLIVQHCEAPVVKKVMPREKAMKDAVDLYRRMRLPQPEEIGFRYPHQVSGGQLQRAMTAMAMACRPDLIIFDEPTTALDVTTQIEVLATIRDIVRQFGTAAIYISHDLAVVAQMADRITVLKSGRAVETAPTRTMLRDPKEDYTKSLWSVRSLDHARAPERPTVGPVLSVRNIDAAYGALKVLEGVSFDVHAGRTVAVVGESGSGKSTAARVISGVVRPSLGEVLFEGRRLAADYRTRSREDLRHIQMVYQMPDTALNPKQRIRDIVGRPMEFYLGLRGRERDRRIAGLLEQIELDPAKYMNRLPSELSGGQKQRIGIARALAAEPKLIICDEVTSALDQIVAAGILKLLADIQKERNLALLFITHDLSTVKAVADEVIVMQHGRIAEAGNVGDVFARPASGYTTRLLQSVPEMDPDWLTRTLTSRNAEPFS
ncbi:ABC transporter ATP-binding protein [Shinella sp. CPCC 101442]|uniref:ABC transporter ATP-binding protein n=1 Tax=Shinella sp. CPCC 101442 TaxID=2932265 RepID=UPI002152818B|nr:ABC transporter ATP-binding protein [Shinella sp. CPCC 101442]MCR6497605.1 ABC transporter ATP-binding protein [Shinella sp. CPCC 101442]